MDHSEAVLLEREAELKRERCFFVKNVPHGFDDWALFSIFSKFGLVDNVRVPPNNNGGSTQFAFVDMLTFEGADAVRAQFVSGNQLKAAGVSLTLCPVHGPKKDGYQQNSAKRVLGVSHMSNRGAAPPSARVPSPVKPTTKSHSQDLPIGQPIKVSHVAAPSTVCVDKFVFYVLPAGAGQSEAFVRLQDDMNKHVATTAPDLTAFTPGDVFVVVHLGVARRARATCSTHAYLLDAGGEVPLPEHAWSMRVEFSQLPTLVVACGLAGVAWSPSLDSGVFPRARALLSQVEQRGQLRVVARYYHGHLNMCDVICTLEHSGGKREEENFASMLAARKLCAYTPVGEARSYTKQEMIDFQGESDVPDCLRDENLRELLVSVKQMRVC